MDSLERVRIILGISDDNMAKLELLSVYLEKSREDIEAFCRDTFIQPVYDEDGSILEYTDVFPAQLRNVQEDLTVYRFKKRGAEGKASYSLGDESVTFDSEIPEDQKQKLYRYVRLFPNTTVKEE